MSQTPRIACVLLPSFPLQVHVRRSPHRAGTAFAVVHGPRDEEGEFIASKRTLLVPSKKAWELGLRAGMSQAQARALVPHIELIPSDARAYQEAACSLAESLLGLSLSVDVGERPGEPPSPTAHRSLYVRVPQKARGDDFGQKLLNALDRQGFRGRVGIADNRFTAWAAAKIGAQKNADELFARDVCTVPRGGEAAFLAPLPLDLLPLSDDVRQMLSTLGITTLGDFAQLPPPSVGRRWNSDGVDFQSLAKGEGPTLLHSFAPRDHIREIIDLDGEVTDTEALAFALRPLADRSCERLRGRSMAASRVVLIFRHRDSHTEIGIEPARPTAHGRTLFDLLRASVRDRRLSHPVTSLELQITEESDPEIEELDLFDRRENKASPEAVDQAIARLESMFGKESVSSARLRSSHRPERAFELTPFAPPLGKKKKTRRAKDARPSSFVNQRSSYHRRRKRITLNDQLPMPLVMNGTSGAMRLIEPPAPQPGCSRLQSVVVNGQKHSVVATYGPTTIDTEWWSESPVERDYYEVQTEDGGRYWIFRQRQSGQYFLHGIFD